jgi:uncharacterized cupredoxin-like copper-binding protein
MRRVAALALTIVLGAALVACSDSNDSKSDTTSGGGGGGVTVPTETGTPIAVEAGDTTDTEQFLKVAPVTAPAGKVTFTFVNNGKKKHEMVILKTDEAFDALAIGADNRVSEDTTVGEIGETEAGKTVVQTFDLEAGNYVLVCNIEKHYGQGMRSAFTVTP